MSQDRVEREWSCSMINTISILGAWRWSPKRKGADFCVTVVRSAIAYPGLILVRSWSMMGPHPLRFAQPAAPDGHPSGALFRERSLGHGLVSAATAEDERASRSSMRQPAFERSARPKLLFAGLKVKPVKQTNPA